MGSEWTSTSLAKCITIKHGFAFKGEFFTSEARRDILLTPGNFAIGGGFKWDKLKFYDGPTPEDYILDEGDLLVTMTDLSKQADTLGFPAIVPTRDKFRFLHNQRLGLVKTIPSPETDSGFLYYLFCTRDYRHHVVAGATGTTVKHTSPKRILEFEFLLPSLPEQKAIAHVLGSLDDKIELNRQMNATLEAMAQTLFKSWFVDFDPVIDNALIAGNPLPEALQQKGELRREQLVEKYGSLENASHSSDVTIHHSLFPNAFIHTKELGWIPDGWEVRCLGDLISLIGGGTPKTQVPSYWNGNIPWFSVVDAPNVSDVFVIDTEKHITELGVLKSSTRILRHGITIISARGTVGKCALVGAPMAMNQSCYGIVGREGISDSFVYYTIREQVADLQRSGHGSVFNTITRDTFRTIFVPFGSAELTRIFKEFTQPFFDRILSNCCANRDLAKARDTLLPKLLSGELRLPIEEFEVTV